ncbi:MAG: SPOR domain-containing protein [Pyrinomonadaceae bacterium]|nr:SPOR domain-containing protein [Pyrinomonadaceae bacterium]
MTYDFSFDKKSISFFLVGVVFVGILLFLAGVLTGANWNKPETLVAGAATDKSVAALEPTQPVLPKEPTLREEAALRRDPAAQSSAAQSLEAIAPTRQNVAPPGMDVERDAGAAAAPKASAQKGNADPVILSTTKPQAAASSAEATEPLEKIATFSIQVGVFLEEKDAERFVEEMEQRGYSASIFTGSDAENRMWYSVRIGAYSDRTEASQAAASFTKQEKIKAVVRPIDSL